MSVRVAVFIYVAHSPNCAMMVSEDGAWNSAVTNVTYWTDAPCCYSLHNVTTVVCKKRKLVRHRIGVSSSVYKRVRVPR